MGELGLILIDSYFLKLPFFGKWWVWQVVVLGANQVKKQLNFFNLLIYSPSPAHGRPKNGCPHASELRSEDKSVRSGHQDLLAWQTDSTTPTTKQCLGPGTLNDLHFLLLICQ
jgi:hypothetical protein